MHHLPEASTQLGISDGQWSDSEYAETEIIVSKDSERSSQDLKLHLVKSDRDNTKEPLTKALRMSETVEVKRNAARLYPETQTSPEPAVPAQEGDDWLTAFYLYFDHSPSRNDGVSFSSQAVHNSTSLLMHYMQENALARAMAVGQQSEKSVVSVSASQNLSKCDRSKRRRELWSREQGLDSRYPCPHCSAAFPFPSKLERHMQSHTGERPFFCTLCKATFSCQSNLGTHERTHSGEKPFSCPHCDSAFSRSSNLKLHLRVHTGERPFPCLLCSSTFKSSTELKRHQKTHTGERPYKCVECKSAFTQASSLSAHRKKHTGEKKFVCKECDARFATASYLKIHSRVHTGIRPYCCAECHALFTQSSSLKKHVQVVHSQPDRGDQQFLCALCSASFSRMCDLIKHEKVHAQHSTYALEEKVTQIVETVQTEEEADHPWNPKNFKTEVDSDGSEINWLFHHVLQVNTCTDVGINRP